MQKNGIEFVSAKRLNDYHLFRFTWSVAAIGGPLSKIIFYRTHRTPVVAFCRYRFFHEHMRTDLFTPI